jgi:hypothetical protein
MILLQKYVVSLTTNDNYLYANASFLLIGFIYDKRQQKIKKLRSSVKHFNRTFSNI